MAAPRRLSWVSFGVTLVLLLLTLIFSMIILLSGVNNNVIGEFLKIDTGHLDASSKLSISEFLEDLSEISDSDYHRHEEDDDDDDDDDDSNQSSSKLPTSYSLTLLTLCAHNSDGSISCAEPRIGFSFDPESHLDLDENDFEEFSDEYNHQLHVYGNTSLFLSVAYLIVILITALSCLHLGLSICFPRMLMLSKFFSLVSTIFLFVAAITSTVTFIRLKDAFNEALEEVGVRTDIGSSMVGYSFGAFGLSFFAFLFMITQSRGHKEPRAAARDVEAKGGLVRRFTDESDEGRKKKSGPVAGILSRVTTWKTQQKYSKVAEKQPAAHHDHPPQHHHQHHHTDSNSSDDQNALMTSAHDSHDSSSASSREYVEDRGLTASPEMRGRLRDDEDEGYDPPRMGRSPQRAHVNNPYDS